LQHTCLGIYAKILYAHTSKPTRACIHVGAKQQCGANPDLKADQKVARAQSRKRSATFRSRIAQSRAL